MHEHVFVLSHEFQINYPQVLDFDEEHESRPRSIA